MMEFFATFGPGIVALAVPAVVWGFKKLLPYTPKWLLPILAAAIGPAGAYALDWLGAIEASGPTLALIGVAGTGIREVVDQLHKLALGQS